MSWVEFHYNTSYHSGLKMSRFQALYGRTPPQYTKGSTSIQALDEALTAREELLCTLKSNLLSTQNLMTMRANTHRRELSFDVGDMVLVCLQLYRQLSVTQGRYHKLCKCYYGPYPILERISKVAYHVGLPTGSRIHPLLHISILKLFCGKVVFQACDLPT